MRIVDVVQGTPEWYAARLGLPTASAFGRIVTSAKGDLSKQADDYISELLDELVRPDAERGFGGNRHTERGKEMEPQARAWYEFVTGYTTRQVGIVLRDDGKIGCSPDSLVDPRGGLEIKCPDGKTHVAYLRGGVLPDEYRQQVHGSLVVTGRDWWEFVSYCPGHKPLRVRVVPDEYTVKVAAALDKFVEMYDAARAEFFAGMAA